MLKKLLLGFFCVMLVACSNNQPALTPLHPDDTILAFGDSLTQGVGGTLSESYPSVLQSLTGLTVINAGVSGEETSQGLVRINDELEKYKPKLVLLCLGGNDMLRKRPDTLIKENLKQIILRIQAAHAEVVLIGAPRPNLTMQIPDFYKELGEELQVPVDDWSLPKLLGIQEAKSDYIHLNAFGYKQLAQNIFELLQAQGAITKE